MINRSCLFAVAILLSTVVASPSLRSSAAALHSSDVDQGGPAPASRQNPNPVGDPQSAINTLGRQAERARSLRQVKDLQVTYQQYAQFGLWREMGSLFADNGDLMIGDQVVHGRAAITQYIVDKYGAGRDGLPAGGIHNQILLAPIVTLSYDGTSAHARWSEVTMLGRYGGNAEWAGGMEENGYIRENGVWKIAKLHYYPQFAGPYETGWLTVAPTSPIVPYHYTPSQAGRPVPDEPGDTPRTGPNQTIETVEQAIQALTVEHEVRNLQNIYGYYVDRKMWDDVIDLFASDGVLEIAGVGVYQGAAGIRKALERDGPAGLQPGEVHDHLQLDVIVSAEPGNQEARARGMELGMLTPKIGEAYWSLATFVNRYVKQDGTWRIREMRIFPKMKADYYQGWARSAVVDSAPGAKFAPDRPTPPADSVADGSAIPTFFALNPATAKPVALPSGSRVVGEARLVAAPTATESAPAGDLGQRLAEARRQLAVAKAYDAVDNISSTLGYYMDDEMWDEWTDTMSKDGRRIQGGGWYIGRDHLYKAMTQGHTTPPSLTNQRTAIRIHMRTQPVIHVAADARSAKIRTRMWLYYASPTDAGAWNSGMYPNDAAVLEDGVWRIDVDEIDETYFSSPSYKQGWAKPAEGGRGRGRGEGPGAAPGGGRAGGGGVRSSRGNTVYAQGIELPPDIPTSVMNGFRRKGFNVNYPDIKPMWFHYRNPVSGRFPEHYCEDIKTCY